MKKKFNINEVIQMLCEKPKYIIPNTLLLGADPSTSATGLSLSDAKGEYISQHVLPMTQFGNQIPGWLHRNVANNKLIVLSEYAPFARHTASSIAVTALENEIVKALPRQTIRIRINPNAWRKSILGFCKGRKQLKQAAMNLTGIHNNDIADAECVRMILQKAFNIASAMTRGEAP